MKKISLVILVSLVLFKQNVKSQDIAFSQFYEKPMLRNPALAGIFEGDVRVTGIYRNQWQSVTTPYVTGGLGGELKLPVGRGNDWVTLGMQIAYDQAGDIKLKRTQFLPVVNYHKSINDNNDQFLSVAFMGGYVNSQFDPTQMRLDDQWLNGSFNPNNPTKQVFNNTGYGYWDLSTGISYNGAMGENDHFYIGAGYFHFNEAKTNFYNDNGFTTIPKKFTLNSGFSFATSDVNKLQIFADYMSQNGNEMFMGGAMYNTTLVKRYDDLKSTNIGFGCFYRWNDAIIPAIKLDLFDITCGLSYDINVSNLTAASMSRGGFELSLTYRAKLNRISAMASKMRCPGF